jgi:hypothetical protein
MENKAETSKSIMMSNPMVIAIHRDINPKQVTRRVVQNQPPEDCGPIVCGPYNLTDIDRRGETQPGPERFGAYSMDGAWASPSPYGPTGTLLWVREGWRTEKSLDSLSGTEIADLVVRAGYRLPWAPIQYEADKLRRDWVLNFADGKTEPGRLRLSRFMPRWASRTKLCVTSVRAERLQDISAAEAMAEGLCTKQTGSQTLYGLDAWPSENWHADPVQAYRHLWGLLHGTQSWDENPLVWVISFIRMAENKSHEIPRYRHKTQAVKTSPSKPSHSEPRNQTKSLLSTPTTESFSQ